MKKKKLLLLKKIDLKNDISEKYLKWMNDLEVHKYTKQKYKKHSLEDIRNFVREKNKSKREYLYGIFIKKKKSNIHIGNIKLGPIKWYYKLAYISYFIGEKNLWGKGYTTLAIMQMIKKAKNKKLKKLKAIFHNKNVGSKKVLVKCGFKIEKRFKSEKIYSINL
mgnify:FL=1